jgi:3-(3-hydroxy-phenyl)propionate hydroxylase
MLSDLDIPYDLGEGHPLLGRRMPDLDLEAAAGPLRVFTLLRGARPVLLNLVCCPLFLGLSHGGSLRSREG